MALLDGPFDPPPVRTVRYPPPDRAVTVADAADPAHPWHIPATTDPEGVRSCALSPGR